MKVILAVAVLFFVCLGEAQTTAKTSSAEDSDLKSTEKQWVAAYFAGDSKTLSSFETDDFTVIASGQSETKAQQLAEVESRGPIGAPQETLEEDIRHFGDVALITGLSGGSNIRFTAVWLKQNGSWKIVHLHYCMGD